MTQARRSTSRGRSTAAKKTARPRTTTRQPRALSRLEKSIQAAEAALKDLRTELGQGGRDLVKDLDQTLKDSRKNLRSLSSTIVKDLGKLQKAATTGRASASRGQPAGTRQAASRTGPSRSAKK
jgi:hypothetical protein